MGFILNYYLIIIGKTESHEAMFITFVSAFMRALNLHGDMIRAAISGAANVFIFISFFVFLTNENNKINKIFRIID